LTDGVWRFGQVEFDRERGRLTVDGRVVTLDRACRVIFAELAAKTGHDVPKGHLLEIGWPDRAVDENSLTKAISRLRHALGDDGDAVETVHGFGYRLAVEPEGTEPRTKAPATAPRSRRPAVLVAGVAAIAVAALTVATLPGEAQPEFRVRNGEAPDAIGRVLWVDDHPENNVTEVRQLEGRKIAVYQVGTTEEALTLLPMYEYGAVISDMGRGDRPLAGLDLLKAMRARGDRRPFFLYTVHSSDAQRKLVDEAGGQAVAETREELYAAILPLFPNGS